MPRLRAGTMFTPTCFMHGGDRLAPERWSAGVTWRWRATMDVVLRGLRSHRVAAVIEVVLRNGRLLRVPEGVAAAHVVALADALEGFGR